MAHKKNSNYLVEIFGWYGAVAILLAFLLVSFKIIPASGYVYQLLNFTGAFGLVIISIAKKVKQSIVLNIFWAIIAIVAIVSLTINS